jgi:hypothetical protein
VRLVLSAANPAAEAAAESLVASARTLETIVVAASQRLADLQRGEEHALRKLSATTS